jgi:hypothetical protein
MNARRLAAIIGLVVCALALTFSAGCSSSQPKTQGLPIQKSVELPSGMMPGVEFVGTSTLPMGEKANIDGWQASGGALASAPTLKAGSYKPVAIADDLAVVSTQAGSANGIAQKVVVFTFTPEGAKKLADFASSHPDDQLAIVLNGKVLVVQNVGTSMADGVITVSGDQDVTQVLESAIRSAK